MHLLTDVRGPNSQHRPPNDRETDRKNTREHTETIKQQQKTNSTRNVTYFAQKSLHMSTGYRGMEDLLSGLGL